MIYVALTEATALATGRPVGELTGHLLRGMIDPTTPPDVRDLLLRLTQPGAVEQVPLN